MNTFFVLAWMAMLMKITLEDATFTIYHTGDIHSNFDQDSKGYGGVGRIITYIKKQRAEGGPSIYLDTGDIFTGSIWFSIHRCKIAADFAKILSPDVMVRC